MLRFTDQHAESISFEPEVFVIAGYTGRDRVQVQRHIDELAHEGIAPPPEVPMLYPMPVELLTMETSIDVPSAQSSGEVEPILIGHAGALYLGIGSDHTARDIEREDIATSKRMCPKPLGPSVLRIEDLQANFDAIALESAVDGEPYQTGSLVQIAPLAALLDLFRSRYDATSFVLSCGTVPLLGHGFRFGRRFSARLSGGVLPAPLALEYQVVVVPPSAKEKPVVPKPEREFFTASDVPWTVVPGLASGLTERILAQARPGVATRILRFEPGCDTSPNGVQVHDFWEEVYILEGSFHDLELDETFVAGQYACRPPGMRHGPWRSESGCLTFEVRYDAARRT